MVYIQMAGILGNNACIDDNRVRGNADDLGDGFGSFCLVGTNRDLAFAKKQYAFCPGTLMQRKRHDPQPHTLGHNERIVYLQIAQCLGVVFSVQFLGTGFDFVLPEDRYQVVAQQPHIALRQSIRFAVDIAFEDFALLHVDVQRHSEGGLHRIVDDAVLQEKVNPHIDIRDNDRRRCPPERHFSEAAGFRLGYHLNIVDVIPRGDFAFHNLPAQFRGDPAPVVQLNVILHGLNQGDKDGLFAFQMLGHCLFWHVRTLSALRYCVIVQHRSKFNRVLIKIVMVQKMDVPVCLPVCLHVLSSSNQ